MFDKKSASSIIEYAKQLKGLTLRQASQKNIEYHGYKGKGNFGQLLEKYYFGYEPNSNAEPDFKEVGIELKSSPLKLLKNGDFRSKERLVLNIINYLTVHQETFEKSSFWKKNAHLLLIFYLHRTNTDVLDYVIKLVDDWHYPKEDLIIIKHDWKIITQKIKDGKAHELSEGDTFYLGACTKGPTASKSFRKQPFSNEKAKQRAYSLKQGYANHIIANIAQEESASYGKIIRQPEMIDSDKTIEEIIISKFEPFFGMSARQIEKEFGLKLNHKAKSYFANITNSIFGIELEQKAEELEKGDIQVKTIRVEENNKIKQSVSFPAFEFTTIYDEHWRTSLFKEKIEKKFLFLFYKSDGQDYRLNKVMFWNMPYIDRNEARRIWLKTKKTIQNGSIFKDFAIDKKTGKPRLSMKGNQIKYNNLPKLSDSIVCHVRPHGADSFSTYPLPIQDKKLKSKEYSKQCFWLNADYVRDSIYLKNHNKQLLL